MSECQSRLSLSARVYNRKRASGLYSCCQSWQTRHLPAGVWCCLAIHREKSECGHQMSETVSTTHLPNVYTCMYIYTPDYCLLHMYYKSMPLVLTPIWLLCIGVRRAKSGPISSAIYLRTVFMQLLGATAAKVSSLLDALACDVTF